MKQLKMPTKPNCPVCKTNVMVHELPGEYECMQCSRRWEHIDAGFRPQVRPPVVRSKPKAKQVKHVAAKKKRRSPPTGAGYGNSKASAGVSSGSSGKGKKKKGISSVLGKARGGGGS